MSALMEHTINCDVCGHWEREIGTATRARRALRRHGWVRRRNTDKGWMEDVCPACVAKQKETP